ncbi:hypothetical protein TcasGA2_TC032102 [Tribolium castaneum]|uniref:Uncharacterized protein n=1 Tax=Tribolium castaneum TaxID=7070 RepID=A0A139WMP1_TRICA|nr:hypothetical protein TcasGA2_TC032102 [Tribolium castaneum]
MWEIVTDAKKTCIPNETHTEMQDSEVFGASIKVIPRSLGSSIRESGERSRECFAGESSHLCRCAVKAETEALGRIRSLFILE